MSTNEIGTNISQSASSSGMVNVEIAVPMLVLGFLTVLLVSLYGRKLCKANTPFTFSASPIYNIVNWIITGVVIAAVYMLLAIILPYYLNMTIYGSDLSIAYSGATFKTFIVFWLWGSLSAMIAEWLRKSAAERKTIRMSLSETTAQWPVVSNIWSVFSIQLVIGFIAFVIASIWVFANIKYEAGTVFIIVLVIYLLYPVTSLISAVLYGSPLTISGFNMGSSTNAAFQSHDISIFDIPQYYTDIPVLLIWLILYIVFAILFAFVRARCNSSHVSSGSPKSFNGKRFGLFLIETAILWIVLIYLTQLDISGSTYSSSSSSTGSGSFSFGLSFACIVAAVIFAAISDFLAIFAIPALAMKSPVITGIKNSAFIGFLAGRPKANQKKANYQVPPQAQSYVRYQVQSQAQYPPQNQYPNQYQ